MKKSAQKNFKLSTQQTTEQSKTRIGQEIKHNKTIPILKGTVAFILVTLSLFHILFEPKSDLVAANDEKYDEIVVNRNSLNQKYREDLKNGHIGVDEFLLKTDELVNQSKAQINLLNKEKRKINQDHSFRGRSSFHFWIFVFGLVTALFFFSCKSLIDDFSRGSTFKFHVVSFTGVLISLFWFIHLVFLTQRDFNKNSYILLILACAAVFSIFVYFLVRYYTYKDDIIKSQLSFIMRVKKYYYDDIAFRALYAEKSGKPYKSEKAVNDCIDEFQEDLKQVTSNI